MESRADAAIRIYNELENAMQPITEKIKGLEKQVEYLSQQRERLSLHNADLEREHVSAKQQLAVANRRIEYLDQQREHLSLHYQHLDEARIKSDKAFNKYTDMILNASWFVRLVYLFLPDVFLNSEVSNKTALRWLQDWLIAKIKPED